MTTIVRSHCLVLILVVVGTVHGDVLLKGAVANDVNEFFEAEIGVFKQEHPSFNVSYESMVSGPALALVSANTASSASSVNFAITQNTAPSSSVCTKNGLLPVPLMAGVGGVFYNVPGLVDAKLDACALAHIFTGSITKWSDPAIQTLNPGAKLPNKPITVVIRDDPGLTPQLLTYLRHRCPSATTLLGASGTFQYPTTFTRVVSIGDMVALINSTLYTIGYVQASSFRGGPEVAIQNREGQFVTSATADRTSFADALQLPQDPQCWGDVETANLPGARTHPLMYIVYYIAPAAGAGRPAQHAVASLALHLLSPGAQQRAADLGYQQLASDLMAAAAANQKGLQPKNMGSVLPSGAIASIVAACVVGAVLLAAAGQVLYRRSLKAGWLCTWPDYTDSSDPEAPTAPVLARGTSLSLNRQHPVV